MDDYKNMELNMEILDQVAGGGDNPDPAQLVKWPWEQVDKTLKGYVWQFKNAGRTYERAVSFIRHCTDNSLVYPFAWGQDEYRIIDRFTELWNTFGQW